MNSELRFTHGLPPHDIAYSSKAQMNLALFNRHRLSPTVGNAETVSPEFVESEFNREQMGRRIESYFLQGEFHAVRELARDIPTDPDAFITWFESLKSWGPGQGDPLFPWLANEATAEEMRWFIGQEVAGEAGFDDLVALTQIRMPTPVKLELARNYWDEMGRGNEKGMHGPMLSVLAKELELGDQALESIVPEALALGNLMIALAANRAFAYHSVGSLGVVELTAPDRARAVYEGLKRLGVSATGQRYYLLHSTLDVQHSITWNREALRPLIASRPEAAQAVAEGALMRLNAGARCFQRYRKHFGFTEAATGSSLHHKTELNYTA